MTNLDSILKSTDITLAIKVCLVKTMVFPVVIYGCESWTKKEAELQRIDALNCGVGEDSWESFGLLQDPTSPSWRKSVLSVHWKVWCWSWNSKTLATWWKSWLIWRDPDAWKGWKWEEKGTTEDEMVGWHHRLNRHDYEQTLGDSEWQGKPVLLQFMGSQRVGHYWVTEQDCSSEYEFKRYNQVLSVVLDTQ